MKMKRILIVAWSMLMLPLYSQDVIRDTSLGPVGHFKKTTLRLPSGDGYSVCGKPLRKFLPPEVFGSWLQATFYVAEGAEVGQVMHLLAQVVSKVLQKDNDFSFLTYEKMKLEIIDQSIEIDSRIVIIFRRESRQPSLGINSIVFNVDSRRKLVYVKWDENDGLIQLGLP
jgi:hypothetical protein